MFKKLTIALHIIIAVCPFILLAYHVKSLFSQEGASLFPLTYVLLHWFGIDVTFNDVSPSIQGVYGLYIYIMRLPLLVWLFILAAPSYIKLYKLTEEAVEEDA